MQQLGTSLLGGQSLKGRCTFRRLASADASEQRLKPQQLPHASKQQMIWVRPISRWKRHRTQRVLMQLWIKSFRPVLPGAPWSRQDDQQQHGNVDGTGYIRGNDRPRCLPSYSAVTRQHPLGLSQLFNPLLQAASSQLGGRWPVWLASTGPTSVPHNPPRQPQSSRFFKQCKLQAFSYPRQSKTSLAQLQ